MNNDKTIEMMLRPAFFLPDELFSMRFPSTGKFFWGNLLMVCIDDPNDSTTAKNEELAKINHCSVRTVQRMLTLLKEHDFIEIHYEGKQRRIQMIGRMYEQTKEYVKRVGYQEI